MKKIKLDLSHWPSGNSTQDLVKGLGTGPKGSGVAATSQTRKRKMLIIISLFTVYLLIIISLFTEHFTVVGFNLILLM